jgi:hypothetical protein
MPMSSSFLLVWPMISRRWASTRMLDHMATAFSMMAPPTTVLPLPVGATSRIRLRPASTSRSNALKASV